MAGVGVPTIITPVDDVDTNGFRMKQASDTGNYIHTDLVYSALMNAADIRIALLLSAAIYTAVFALLYKWITGKGARIFEEL